MSAYCFFDNLEVTEPAALETYRQRVVPIIEKFSGRYVVLGGPFEVKEGTWSPVFPVVLEFPDLATANAWYDSDDYRELKALRQSAVRCNAVFLSEPLE